MMVPLFFNQIFIKLSGYEDMDKLSYENDFGSRLD